MGAFADKWFEAVKRKNSVLCAGLDPREESSVNPFDFEGKKYCLPRGTNKLDWALRFMDEVGNMVAAYKPNKKFWESPGDEKSLAVIAQHASAQGVVVIEDNKLADIGDTNLVGIYNAASLRQADAVTIAPYAGNMKHAVEQGHAKGVGVITMCIMSNPEYEEEKLKLVPLLKSECDETKYLTDDITTVFRKDLGRDVAHVPQYIRIAQMAGEHGADALVIGAPSKKDSPKQNHIKSEEIAKARQYAGPNMLVLLPGVGAQGGEADLIWQHFAADNVIVNVGRALMFPSSGTRQEAALMYRDMFNAARLIR